MATKKAGGTAKNLRDSNPKYLGTKLYSGERAQPGSVIIRQRGTRILAGKNTRIGKDHTIFALKNGVVNFRETRKTCFDGRMSKKKIVDVI
ncbi:MAG: 50S ribosomal protein L27 [Patescibacteria group bacterium]